jgi:hypothetical protein
MGANKLNLKQPKGRELLGGDLLAQCLQQLGVDVIFGLHGGHLDAFLMGCTDIGIKLIDTRHETVAVQAAEGYSKVAGKTGVCFVTANSGYVLQAQYSSTSGIVFNETKDSVMVSQALRRPSRTDLLFSALPAHRLFAMQRRIVSRASMIRLCWRSP